MFLNEVAIGKEHRITQDDSSLRAAPSGFDSVLACGQQEPGRIELNFHGSRPCDFEIGIERGKYLASYLYFKWRLGCAVFSVNQFDRIEHLLTQPHKET